MKKIPQSVHTPNQQPRTQHSPNKPNQLQVNNAGQLGCLYTTPKLSSCTKTPNTCLAKQFQGFQYHSQNIKTSIFNLLRHQHYDKNLIASKISSTSLLTPLNIISLKLNSLNGSMPNHHYPFPYFLEIYLIESTIMVNSQRRRSNKIHIRPIKHLNSHFGHKVTTKKKVCGQGLGH